MLLIVLKLETVTLALCPWATVTLMELQVGDLLVGIGDVCLADSSPQEAMAQVASIVRVTLALKSSHGCQGRMASYKLPGIS